MTKPVFMVAATIGFAAVSPAFATAVVAAQAAKPAAQPAQALTRATLVRQLGASFKAVDTNGDGTLSVAEVGAAELKGLQNRAAAVRSRVEAEFNKLDTNHDGQLNKAEFMAALPAAPTSANGTAVVTQLDKNKDGKISVDEYNNPRLAAFDRLDSNHDGTISEAERQAARAGTRKR